MRKWIPIYAAAVLLFTSLHPVYAARNEHPPAIKSALSADNGLKQQVDLWVNELSKQPPFEDWKSAEYHISALGPGTHGWLITFTADNAPLGYMVVHAKPEGGYQLGEYGYGKEPLFTLQPLYSSMVQLELIPSTYPKRLPQNNNHNPLFELEQMYLSPLLAVWKVTMRQEQKTVHYFDAKTGEYLPISEKEWDKADQSVKKTIHAEISSKKPASPISTIVAKQLNPAFDVYERFPWLTKPPIKGNVINEVSLLLEQRKKVWYSAEPYGKTVRYVWPVIGYQQWDDGRLYIAVAQEGARFIPSHVLTGAGSFYD
ncbi:hypothetical protein [Paenibacillus abyssi]|uniref:PepSY domain-containing protein n=1 Tax=Paenibacillus abyssi TaxID=1340531 RepID=A0A917G4F6_9BACL|nr:hypothetical protein [Paenibacillus abyssi]GGG22085.1 hypothetical protein GCM10010916_43420 [Paenibacillus abyssi]